MSLAEVEAPVRALPLVPSATMEDDADLYPAGRPVEETGVVVVDPMRVMTPLERVARPVLSAKEREEEEGESLVASNFFGSSEPFTPFELIRTEAELTDNAHGRSSSTGLGSVSSAGHGRVRRGEGEGSSVRELVSTEAVEGTKERISFEKRWNLFEGRKRDEPFLRVLGSGDRKSSGGTVLGTDGGSHGSRAGECARESSSGGSLSDERRRSGGISSGENDDRDGRGSRSSSRRRSSEGNDSVGEGSEVRVVWRIKE